MCKKWKKNIIILIYLSLERYLFFLFLIFMNYCKSFDFSEFLKKIKINIFRKLLWIASNFLQFFILSYVRDKNTLNKREMWRLRNRYGTKGRGYNKKWRWNEIVCCIFFSPFWNMYDKILRTNCWWWEILFSRYNFETWN